MKHFGSIDKRGDKFRARVKINNTIRSRTFATRNGAISWLNDLHTALRTDRYDAEFLGSQISMSELLSRFVTEKAHEWKPSTKMKASAGIYALQRDHADILDLPADKVTTTHIAELIHRMRNPEGKKKVASNSTINQTVGFIRTAVNVANAKWGMELRNPVKPGTLPRRNPGRDRRLRAGEYEKLISAAHTYETNNLCNTPIALIIRFAIETAARQNEIATLRCRDIYLREDGIGIVSISAANTKTSESRSIPLNRAFTAELCAYIKDKPAESLIFASSADKIRQAFARASDRANLEDFRFHDLRHEGTSRLFEKHNLTPMFAQIITGHKTISMLARYTHLDTDQLIEKMKL